MYLVPGRSLKTEARTSVTYYKVDTHLHGCMPVVYLLTSGTYLPDQLFSGLAMTIVCLPKGRLFLTLVRQDRIILYLPTLP